MKPDAGRNCSTIYLPGCRRITTSLRPAGTPSTGPPGATHRRPDGRLSEACLNCWRGGGDADERPRPFLEDEVGRLEISGAQLSNIVEPPSPHRSLLPKDRFESSGRHFVPIPERVQSSLEPGSGVEEHDTSSFCCQVGLCLRRTSDPVEGTATL